MSLTDVGLVGSMYGVGCLIGNVSGGILFDKFDTAKSMTYAGCMYVLSIAMMIIISLQPYGSSMSRTIGMAYSIFCGLAVFSYMSGPAFMAKDLFGAKEQGVMLGLSLCDWLCHWCSIIWYYQGHGKLYGCMVFHDGFCNYWFYSFSCFCN